MGSNHRHADSESAVLPAELPGIGSERYTTLPPPALATSTLQIATAIGRRLTVAVWAEHPEVFQPIVVADSVDVVDLNAEPFAPPISQATFAATIF